MTRDLTIHAVIPVKETSAAKQRLAAVLPQHLRQEFARAMLEDVLDAVSRAPSLAGIIVVTVDDAASELANRYGATIVTDGARDGHTGAVMAAAKLLAARGVAMLTLPGDIPLVEAQDIEALIAAHRGKEGFTIAPARDERGSNAILCSPADTVPLRFGENSYFPHLATARAYGIEPVSIVLPRIGLDIDCPDDLRELLKTPARTRAHSFLQAHGVSTASLLGMSA